MAIALNGTIFGVLSVLAVFFSGIALFMSKVVAPNKEISNKLSDERAWTPELNYVHMSRLFIGFLHGFLVAGLICVFIYAK